MDNKPQSDDIVILKTPNWKFIKALKRFGDLIDSNFIDELIVMINEGAVDVNGLYKSQKLGQSPLLSQAIVGKHDKLIDCLINNGADCNVRGANGRTPMNEAAAREDGTLLWRLLSIDYDRAVAANLKQGNVPTHSSDKLAHITPA